MRCEREYLLADAEFRRLEREHIRASQTYDKAQTLEHLATLQRLYGQLAARRSALLSGVGFPVSR